MEIQKTAFDIWKEYEVDKEYKNTLDLYETVKTNNNFYHGSQWEGLNAPSIEKPVFNIIKPSVNYLTSMLISDDIGTNVKVNNAAAVNNAELIERVIQKEIGNVFESNNIGTKNRESITSCAIDGDTARHIFWDTTVETGYAYKGGIKIERIDNTDIIFGDRSINDVQLQPYVTLVAQMMTDEVKALARANGKNDDDIVPDDEYQYSFEDEHKTTQGKYTTVLIKYFKENGTVHYIKSTKAVVVEDDTDTGLTLYPISYFSWDKVKHSYHGVSPVTSIVPNQIYINKLMAMSMEYNKRMAFPKILYDRNVIQKWSNDVSTAIAVSGSPDKAIFSAFQSAPVNPQVMELIEHTISKTKDSLGVYDAALGNAKPENTSAIVALQRASSQPLELQRMDFYQFIEDSIRVIVDMMGVYYGPRAVNIESLGGDFADMKGNIIFDYGVLRNINLLLNVEIGQATYWSELMQVQTLDNMLGQQLIDPKQYLELLPDGYIPSRDKILNNIKEKEAEQVQQPQQQQITNDLMSAIQAPLNIQG